MQTTSAALYEKNNCQAMVSVAAANFGGLRRVCRACDPEYTMVKLLLSDDSILGC